MIEVGEDVSFVTGQRLEDRARARSRRAARAAGALAVRSPSPAVPGVLRAEAAGGSVPDAASIAHTVVPTPPPPPPDDPGAAFRHGRIVAVAALALLLLLLWIRQRRGR